MLEVSLKSQFSPKSNLYYVATVLEVELFMNVIDLLN